MVFFLRFKIYELIEEHGHKVLYIPPYHCHLNPTELVWSQTKRHYSPNIGGMEAVK
jgi:transposase